MRSLNLEALAFCIAWVALALVGLYQGSIKAGLILSIGLFPIIMLTSMVILSRTGSFVAERTVRWGILVAAGVGLASYLDVAGG